MDMMKQQASKEPRTKSAARPGLESGLPGTPAEHQRGLRDAIRRHAETLRTLAER